MCQIRQLAFPTNISLSGVSKGSVLDHTFFLLFVGLNDVSDIFNNLAVSFKLYADDLNCILFIILHHPVTIYLLLSIDYMTGALPGSGL